jgi:hypothetical protein
MKNWKGFGRQQFGIVTLLAWHLPGGTEGATKILSQVRWCPG